MQKSLTLQQFYYNLIDLAFKLKQQQLYLSFSFSTIENYYITLSDSEHNTIWTYSLCGWEHIKTIYEIATAVFAQVEAARKKIVSERNLQLQTA